MGNQQNLYGAHNREQNPKRPTDVVYDVKSGWQDELRRQSPGRRPRFWFSNRVILL